MAGKNKKGTVLFSGLRACSNKPVPFFLCIVVRNRLHIRTEKHTQLDGALMASNTGHLKLDTNSQRFSAIAGHGKAHSYPPCSRPNVVQANVINTFPTCCCAAKYA